MGSVAFTLTADNTAPRLPFGPDEKPPVNLVEKHRPRQLSDVRGQGDIVYQLQSFLEAPASCAMLFSGDTGTGKTSTALAFARELGAVEYGGLHQIKSGEMDAETVENVLSAVRYTPMPQPGSSGWHCIVCDEADSMSAKAQALWLSALEDLPPRCVVIFTSNHPDKFQRRFLDRCEHYAFRSNADVLRQDAQSLVNAVWHAETGRTDAPDVSSLPGVVDKNGCLSFRAVVQGLNPLLRSARRAHNETAEKTAPVQPQVSIPAPAPAPVPALAPVASRLADSASQPVRNEEPQKPAPVRWRTVAVFDIDPRTAAIRQSSSPKPLAAVPAVPKRRNVESSRRPSECVLEPI